MKTVIVGGSGNLGQWVVKEFLLQGHEVINLDARKPQKSLCPDYVADILDGGAMHSFMQAVEPDAVIHLAAIPSPLSNPPADVFRVNTIGAYNVMEAAVGAGAKRIAFASTDSTYGFLFAKEPWEPLYLPVDENHPQKPQDPYGLSKLTGENIAKMFTDGDHTLQIACLRICHLEQPEILVRYSEFNTDPEGDAVSFRRRERFNYVDMRDAARAFRLAVEVDAPGFHAYNIAAKDTCMDVPTIELIRKICPDITDIRADFSGYRSFFNSELATKELGWVPQYSWRNPQW